MVTKTNIQQHKGMITSELDQLWKNIDNCDNFTFIIEKF